MEEDIFGMEFIGNIFIGKIILYRSVWSGVKSRYNDDDFLHIVLLVGIHE